MNDIKNLDFDQIKQNLLNYLKSQSKFSGYNFEGSALNTLIDILSYNTYYQAFYNNMVFSEMFLDSATKRSSIVSLAKMLGYTPASAKSSMCIVQLTKTTPFVDEDLFISSGKILKTVNNNEATDYVIMEDIHLKPLAYDSVGNVISITTGPVKAYQGKIKTTTFVHDAGIPFRKYMLEYDNIDVDTIKVQVQDSTTNTNGIDDVWQRVTDITKVGQDDKMYFIEETPYGYFSIYFGDGILGKRLSDGNMITVTALQTNGDTSNGIGTINPSTTFRTDNYTVNVLVPSSGGSSKETKESIKLKAPKSFTAQERAVTADDYKNILYKDFPNIKSVSTWGGEENNPPEYGKIFISVEMEDGLYLTNEQKAQISNNLIKNRSVVGIVPVIIDPEVLYINLNVGIKCDLSKLEITKQTLETNIKKKILSYVDSEIGFFDGDFYANELVNYIDSIHESIIGITINPTMEKRIVLDLYNPQNYIINFKNKLSHFESCFNSIKSSAFYYFDTQANVYRTCYLEDNTKGLVNIVYYDLNNNQTVLKNIGVIDYEKGIITLENFQVTSLIGASRLRIYASPNEKDIFCDKNDLIFLDKLDENALLINLDYLPYRNRK